MRVPKERRAWGGGWPELAVAAHYSRSVATAIRILEDFADKELGAGDRVVFTGASSAVAQVVNCTVNCIAVHSIYFAQMRVGVVGNICLTLRTTCRLSSCMYRTYIVVRHATISISDSSNIGTNGSVAAVFA